jgi:hypothetical protein
MCFYLSNRAHFRSEHVEMVLDALMKPEKYVFSKSTCLRVSIGEPFGIRLAAFPRKKWWQGYDV